MVPASTKNRGEERMKVEKPLPDNTLLHMINEDRSAGCFTALDDMTAIPDGAFAGNKNLTHADLRNVRYIGARAFQECSNLESVEMNNASVIGPRAFEFCRSLRSVSFGSVTDIGEEAFLNCSMLDIPELPPTLISIGSAAFSHTAMRSIDLHWMEEIPSSLCSCCAALTHADISRARLIGEDAFAGCSALSRVEMESAEKIGHRSFHKCRSFALGRLPDTLLSVGDDAFDCVREGTVIPERVREIGKNCFGPVDKKKSIRLYEPSLYCFRNYFPDECVREDGEEVHFHLWESSIDVSVLDRDGNISGFLPLYSDLDPESIRAMKSAFREDNTFDYSFLDTILFTGMRWNQRAKDRLAVMRLIYPFELTEPVKTEYVSYLNRHLDRIAQHAVRDRDIGILSFLCDKGLIFSGNILGILDHSVSLSASECTAFLMKRLSEMDVQKDMIPDEL